MFLSFISGEILNSYSYIIMKRFTNREIFGTGVILSILVSAFFSWSMFFSAVAQPDPLNISGAIAWFSFLGAFFLLGTVVWQRRMFQVLGAILVFLPGFFFIQTWSHVVGVFVAVLIVFSSTQAIASEMRDRIQFRFFRMVRTGSFTFILGLSLALSSAYFSSIERLSWEELVPRFNLGEGTASIVFKTVAYFYPSWKNLADEGLTVDGFLLSLPREDLSSSLSTPSVTVVMDGGKVSPELTAYLKQELASQLSTLGQEPSEEMLLQAGREQIALLVGRDVSGNEKIADVFSSALQHKIVTVLSSEQTTSHVSPTIVPVVLAVLLFFTLLPLGSLVVGVWILGGLLLFRGAVWLGWLTMERVMVEQERLLP